MNKYENNDKLDIVRGIMKRVLLLLLILFSFNVSAKVEYVGDVDDNGKVGTSDYILIRKHIVGTRILSNSEKERADVNNDKKISSADYVLIKKAILNRDPLKELPSKQYTVTYNPNGGSGSNVTQTVDYNTDWKTKGEIFTRTGFSLIGWSPSATGSVSYTLNKDQGKYTSTSNLILYAIWQIKQFTITYNPNGGSGSSTTQTVDYNTNWTTKGDIYTRSGYTQVGWSTSASGNTTHSLNKDQGRYTSTNNLTLYAVWETQQLSVIYNSNGGNESNVVQVVEQNKDWTTKGPIFTRNGYSQVGWSTSSNGSTTHNMNINQGKYPSSSSLTLYAVWRKIDSVNLPPLPQNVLNKFRVTQEYDSDTLKYWIESTDDYSTYGSTNLLLTHIWIKDPDKQIRIALGGGTTLGNKKPVELMNNEINRLSLSNKGLIAVNSSFFGDSRIPSWGSYQSTRILFYNGQLIRDDCNIDFGENKNIYSSYGITKYGEIRYYESSSQKDCEVAKQQMISDGVKYSGTGWGVIRKSIADPNKKGGESRTMICPMDRNNFVLFSAYNYSFENAAYLAYNILGCQTLINIDGGGSRTLIFKKKSAIDKNQCITTERELADMLYFVEQ